MQNRIDEILKKARQKVRGFSAVNRPERLWNQGNGPSSADETLGAWVSVARALHVSPAYLVGWSDEEEEQSSVEKQQHWYDIQMGQLKDYADKMVEPLKNIKIPAPTPTHGVKITLDNGQVIYDSREYEDLDAYSFAGEWLHLDSHSVAIKHIVSIEKVEGD